MLSTEFATQLQPIVEKILMGLNDLQMLKCDVLVTLGLIIAVDFLQTFVK